MKITMCRKTKKNSQVCVFKQRQNMKSNLKISDCVKIIEIQRKKFLDFF